MVLYLAHCKTREEAEKVSQKMIAGCPSLLYSRVLSRPQDLDFYNTDLIASEGENIRDGFSMTQPPPTERPTGRRYTLFMVATVFVFLAGAFSILAATRSESPGYLLLTAIILCLALAGAAMVVAVANPIRRKTPESRAFERARAWLSRGMPVVIAASEGIPEDSNVLPDNVVYFDGERKTPLRRTA